MRLIKAHAGGGLLWYSKSSEGRMVSYQMMKFFIGENQARELFLRSKSNKTSKVGLDCPSCANSMKIIFAPTWTGGFDVEVCDKCHVFWLAKNMHPEVPAVNDLIVESGDTTVAGQLIDDQVRILLDKENIKLNEDFTPPDDLLSKIAGIFGLPVEIHKRDDPFGFIGKVLAIIFVCIYALTVGNDIDIFVSLGFYPDDFFRNNCLNLITAPFLHGSLSHLVFNMYFYLVFANDDEKFLGPLNFFFFIFISIVLGGVFSSFMSTSTNIPHIGFSGVISSLVTFYALQFKDTKVGFAFPIFHYKVLFPKSGDVYPHFSIRWIRLPIIWVLAWWVCKEVALYSLFERNGVSSVSHSGHLSGYLAGLLLWLCLRESVNERSIGD
jgi:membrane associated rhomboid family serine protease